MSRFALSIWTFLTLCSLAVPARAQASPGSDSAGASEENYAEIRISSIEAPLLVALLELSRAKTTIEKPHSGWTQSIVVKAVYEMDAAIESTKKALSPVIAKEPYESGPNALMPLSDAKAAKYAMESLKKAKEMLAAGAHAPGISKESIREIARAMVSVEAAQGELVKLGTITKR
jgi:hypothetical protein